MNCRKKEIRKASFRFSYLRARLEVLEEGLGRLLAGVAVVVPASRAGPVVLRLLVGSQSHLETGLEAGLESVRAGSPQDGLQHAVQLHPQVGSGPQLLEPAGVSQVGGGGYLELWDRGKDGGKRMRIGNGSFWYAKEVISKEKSRCGG